MADSRGKQVLGIISIISLISASYLLFKLSSKIETNPSFYLRLAAAAVSSLNIAVLFAGFAFGILGSISMTTLAVVVALWFGLRSSLYKDYIFILPFFVTAFIGYSCSKLKERVDHTYLLRMEKLDERLNILSHTIENKKIYIKSLEGKLNGYSILKEVAEVLSTVLSLAAVNKLIIERALKMLGKRARALLFLVDMEKQELALSSANDTQTTSKVMTKKGDYFDRWVLRNRKPLIIEDITKDFRFPAESVEGAKNIFRSLIAAPLVNENKIIGMLRVDSQKEFTYTHDDLRLLDIISDLGAVAVQNALLYSRTQELAIRDGLTGLYLRRFFLERLQEEIKRAARKDKPMSILMVDVDHFKDYNDKYGHAAGDLVLKHLARKIASMAKKTDILARYGGEEIALLLFEADKDEALKEAEAIRKKIEKEPLILRKEEMKMTVSIGVAGYPQDGMLEKELIRIADERLYKAKALGRNKVCAGS